MEQLQEAALAFAGAAVSVLAAFVAAWMRDRAARLWLDSALGRAAGLVLADPRVQAAGAAALGAAAEVGANYLRRTMPGTLAKLGVPPGRAAEMVAGEAGRILALGIPPGSPAAAVLAHVGAGKQ